MLSLEALQSLAKLLRERNALDEKIAKLIGRPAMTGHIGEYIASSILGIELERSASNKGFDGYFLDGLLARRTVNIKCYTKREGNIDLPENGHLRLDDLPNYYLVLTGAKSGSTSSRGTHLPLVIRSIYLFDSIKLVSERHALQWRGEEVKIGRQTSLPGRFWGEAEIYPLQKSNILVLTDEQKNLLDLFYGEKIGSKGEGDG